MSFQAALSKLPSPVKDLVTSATEDEGQDFGKCEKDQKEVVEWIEKAANGDTVKPSGLKVLDSHLLPRTYLVSNHLTAADVALYGALHPIISKLQPSDYYSHPALTRYFDHIQTRPTVRKSADTLSPSFPLVPFDLVNAPAMERKEPTKKEKSKLEAKPTIPAAKTSPADAQAQKIEKKKGSGPAEEVGTKKTAAEDSGEPVPSMIDLRVGRIIDIQKHPDADGLYVEQIDIGEETGPRTVVSGLVHYIPIEQMRDKYLITVCNLKPANMRGIKSFAMVLCAISKDGKERGIELLQPPANSKPGDRVYFEGSNFENATPLSQLNPKKKIFETIQPGFITLDSKEAAWINPDTKSVHKIRTKEGVCIAPTLVGASLS